MGCNKSDATIQIEREQRRLKSSILNSQKEEKEMMFQTLLGTNEKTKITIIVAGLILLIAIGVTLGLFIGLLDPVTIDDSQQTTTNLSKACQGNTGYCCPLILSLFDYTIYVHGIALNLSLI